MLYSAFSHINGERFRKPTDMLMSNKKQRIGLVLSMVPAYSETFFRNKVRVLENAGFKVILFAGGGKDAAGDFRHLRIGYDSQTSALRKILPAILAVIRLVISAPGTYRLYRLNRTDGFSLRKNLLSLLNAAHIVGYKLDWLHFGFASNGILLENLALVAGAKMAVSIRGYDISLHPIKYPGCYALLWKRIDKLHYLSDYQYRKALEDGMPVDVDAMQIEPAVDPSILEKMSSLQTPLSNPAVEFLTIGRLTWKKGYPQMLNALRLLKADGIHFTYRIIGEGSDAEEILYLIKAFALENEVVLEGKKDHAETMDLLSRCDIYLQYSVQEGFCNAVIEAQLLGRLCIVSDAEGLPENVIHEKTGWVVPANEPLLLKERILEVISLPEAQQEKIRMDASQRIVNEFSLAVQERKFIRFYGG